MRLLILALGISLLGCSDRPPMLLDYTPPCSCNPKEPYVCGLDAGEWPDCGSDQ